MEDFFDGKKAIVAFCVGIVVTLVLSLVSLVVLWKTDFGTNVESVATGTTTAVSSDLGSYKVINTSRDDQVEVYALDLVNKLAQSDVDGLYELLNPGYIEYFSITKDSFKKKLETLGILGKNLELSSYDYASLDNTKVFAVKYATSDNLLSGSINILETSPNVYTIAFDNFVSYVTEPTVYIQDGIQFTLSNQLWLNSMYKVKLNIKNLNEERCIVNSSNYYENFYIKLSTTSELRTNTTVVAGDTITLEKNGEMNCQLEFSISELSFSSVDSLIVKDIMLSNTGISKDYEFEL